MTISSGRLPTAGRNGNPNTPPGDIGANPELSAAAGHQASLLDETAASNRSARTPPLTRRFGGAVLHRAPGLKRSRND